MLQRFIDLINPWRSLTARIAWLFSGLSILLALLAGQIAGNASREAVERDVGILYANQARHVADVINFQMVDSLNALEVTSGILGADGLVSANDAKSRVFESLRRAVTAAAWVGVADERGKIVASDRTQDPQKTIADSAWFKKALTTRVISAPETSGYESDKGRTFAVIATPIRNAAGVTTGVAFAYIDTAWMNNLWRESEPKIAGSIAVELNVFNSVGIAILSPRHTNDGPSMNNDIPVAVPSIQRNAALGSLVSKTDLLGYARTNAEDNVVGPDWIVVLREPLTSAYKSANTTAANIRNYSLLLGMGLSATAAFATWLMTRGLAQITASADALRLGKTQTFVPHKGQDEPARISHSLALLFNALKSTNLELEDLNRNLDQKVIERTREVQRLSEETRSAAMTRERLRISRDLHDTLAHSMLAILTQIRLMKKLLQRRPERLAEELDRAELAAQEGLNRARDAVIDLRYFAVRDDGLEQALRKLVAKLKERTEVNVTLAVAEEASTLAGPKAETIYRVAEEAIHNIEKHAHAKQVLLTILLDQSSPLNHKLTLLIEDDGQGFDTSLTKPGHFGMVGMREQAEVLGASLDVQSAPGQGTRLKLVALV